MPRATTVTEKLVPMLARGHVDRSYLGVSVRDLTPELARNLKMDKLVGALVAEVVPGSPADLGGVRAGDVIVSLEGTPVHNANDLPWLASSAGVRAKVPVEVLRDGKRVTLSVQLKALPRQMGGEEEPGLREKIMDAYLDYDSDVCVALASGDAEALADAVLAIIREELAKPLRALVERHLKEAA